MARQTLHHLSVDGSCRTERDRYAENARRYAETVSHVTSSAGLRPLKESGIVNPCCTSLGRHPNMSLTFSARSGRCASGDAFLSLLQDFGNLRRINRRGHVAVDDLQFSASGLVRDCRYLSLDNFAAVKTDPDAGAYAVIHIVKYTRYPILSREAEMTLTLIAARLRHLASSIETLPAEDRERDIPDEMVPKLVMNAFVDDKFVKTLRTKN